MVTTITKSNDHQVARPLSVISGLIKKEWEQAEADQKDHWKKITLLLVEAWFGYFKMQWDEFKTWFEEQDFAFGFKSAREKMLTLSKLQKTARAMTVELPYYKLRTKKPTYEMPAEEIREKVRKSVEMSRRILAEAATKRDETDAIRKLAIQIVDIGFKTLSAKLHPDRRGGSHDAMRRLNEARRLLKSYLG